jgi:TonB family protein
LGHVNFMVDKQGRPYEPTIVDSIGNPLLEKIALETVAKWKFEPATLGGVPVGAAQTLRLNWTARGEPGARPSFIKGYTDARAAIAAGDRQRADAQLAELKPRNLYEEANLGLAWHEYYQKWGTEKQQLDAVRRTLAAGQHDSYLTRSSYLFALQTALALEVRTKDFGRAVSTWERLRKSGLPEDELRQWQKTIAGIEALRNDATAYGVPGEIARGGTSWFYRLFKQHFQVKVASGAITEIKLRCDRQYLLIPFDATLRYTISGADDGCSVELIGDPGTRFELIQS